MSNSLPITNVINISVSTTQAGVGAYNTSNLALFTSEPYQSSFGTNGYQLYLSPTQVGLDFGTGSRTYAMANAVFSQQPNVLNGGGYLVIIPLTVAVQSIAFSATPTSGSFVLNYGGNATASIAYNASAAAVQTALQAVAGLSAVTVTGSISSSTTLTVTLAGCYGVQSLLTVSSNTLSPATTVTVTTSTAGQTIGAAITAASSLVQFFGIMVDHTIAEIGSTDLLAAAAIVQALNKIAFWVSFTSADIASAGMLDQLRSGSFTQSRGLYYAYGATVLSSVTFMAAYAGLALSTNFSGNNTTQTIHLKTLLGVQADTTLTSAQLTLALAAGADTYPSLQGVPKVFCSGTNSFWDQVYNLQWFVGALQVAGFNYLAGASTKVPQTEAGMDGLKGAYRQVCEQAVTNQYFAPGTWTAATTFGSQTDFLNNIANRGYYIFSTPLSQQSTANRVARQASLIQIAGKQAGAVHSSSVVVTVNA